MEPRQRYAWTNVALFVVATVHAALTWPADRAAVLFVGGAAVAFVLEVLGVRAGLFEHAMEPELLGVPLAVIVAWPAIVYLTYRVGLVVVPAGLPAASVAAVLATLLDAATEPGAVREGVWSYPEHPLSSVRVAGIPAWNYVAWLAIVFATAMLPTIVGA